MSIKLLALDLDGTLTNSKKIITPHTLAALDKAQQAGVRLVLASGRPTVGIAPLAEQLQLAQKGGYILSYNGGKILDCTTGAVPVQHAFPPDLIAPVCSFAKENGAVALTYNADGILCEDDADPYVLEEARINNIPVQRVENLPAAVQGTIHKLLVVGDPAKMPHVEEKMQQMFAGRLSIYRSQPFFVETMPLGVEKAASLQILLQTLGYTAKQLMACGDGWNDLPMLRLAGTAVAMGNAVPEVKVAADYVTADNDNDGVAQAVEKFILQEGTKTV